MDIQPIETTYNGVTFRSRLEARWAMTFDILGVRWFYEHEGYQTSTGFYVPDFWLPDTYLRHKYKKGVLFEVKPAGYGYTHKKLEEVAHSLKVGGILANGFEWEFDPYGYLGKWIETYEVEPGGDDSMVLYKCKCGCSTFEYQGSGNYECSLCDSPDYQLTKELSEKAYNHAIKYRFW